jgi:hypothetical protein
MSLSFIFLEPLEEALLDFLLGFPCFTGTLSREELDDEEGINFI